MVLPNDVDELHPSLELEKEKHKLKRLVPTPDSFFINHGFQPLANSCCMRKLPDGPLPTNQRPFKAH